MEKQNVTLSLPKELLRKAKILAVERQLSLSALMTDLLRNAVEKDSRYEEAKRRQLAWLESGFDMGIQGEIDWKRQDLHEQ